MRILNILPYSPCPPYFGGALRVYHLLRQMVQHHEVSVIMYSNEEGVRHFRSAFGDEVRDVRAVALPAQLAGPRKRVAQLRSLLRGKSATTWAFHSDEMQREIDSLVEARDFDLIQYENYPIGVFQVNAPGALSVLDAQNVEYDNVSRMARAAASPLRRMFYSLERHKVYREEGEVIRRQDAILVTSARDKLLMDGDFPGIPKFVIPNGVDVSFFSPSEDEPEPYSLVFTGAMNYFPNVDGMLYFLAEIFPRIKKEIPQAKIYVVGGGPSRQLLSEASDDVIVTGFVEDVRPFVRRASVYVVPLRMGGGTRLKVVEAFAMRKPVVTSSVGCEGLAVVHDESALIADTPEAFASSVVALMKDRALRRRLSETGHALVRSHYEWGVIGVRLAEAYESIAGLRRAPRRSAGSRVNQPMGLTAQ